jgi:uncharacterized membrane protein (UPF0182 family)
MKRSGWILSGLLAAFLFFDAGSKILKTAMAVNGGAQAGFSANLMPGIGWALLISTVLFLIPRTILLGGILLAAYLGGAVCASVRLHAPVALIAFPVVYGVLVWVAIFLRDERFPPLLAGPRSF